MRLLITYLLMFIAGAAAAISYFHLKEGNHDYAVMNKSHHENRLGDQHHTAKAYEHDEENMPGLQGKDTSEREVSDLKEIFRSHKGIERNVTNIPNGIITVTEAKDEVLREAIVSHVSMMVTRLQDGQNPEVIIQSPTLDALFEFHVAIDTEIELTDMGVKVIQTSANPQVVKLLQTHAVEVSDMSERGMQAVHERMAVEGH